MGVYFQDYMASKLAKGAPITAIAAIIENNTSGIITNKKLKYQQSKKNQQDISMELGIFLQNLICYNL